MARSCIITDTKDPVDIMVLNTIYEHPTTGVRKRLVSLTPITWEVISVSVPDHSHPTHGDINFTGKVSADGNEGLTGERIVGGYKITFKKGLLTGFAPV